MRAKALRLLAAGGVAAVVMLPGAAMAQTAGCPYGSGNCDGGTVSSNNVGSTGATTPADSSGGSLPFTGGDVVGLALIGVGAVAGGAALARSSKRRSAEV
jgi:hypothetical protein